MENLVNQFGEYLLSVNLDEEKKTFIHGCIINHPNKLNLIRMFRAEDETENKTEIINDQTVQKFSQVSEWINVFGLRNDQEVKNKLKECLVELLKYKN
jgi:ribulose bisphosphate carboxylase small subunit